MSISVSTFITFLWNLIHLHVAFLDSQDNFSWPFTYLLHRLYVSFPTPSFVETPCADHRVWVILLTAVSPVAGSSAWQLLDSNICETKIYIDYPIQLHGKKGIVIDYLLS